MAAYAGLRTGQAYIEAIASLALGKFYGACHVVLSPSSATDARLLWADLGGEGGDVAAVRVQPEAAPA